MQTTLSPVRVRSDFADIRRTQQEWAQTTIASRLQIVRRIRDRLAAGVTALVDCFPKQLIRSRADSITCEILPLAEACRFLEREAGRILASRSLSSSARPLWLSRVKVQVQREPLGLVLVIGASNYPLFLAGVQTLQALVAGNAVLLKPGRGGGAVLNCFAELAIASGVPGQLITVLDEQVTSAEDVIDRGVDKIVLTGSVESGRAVLRRAAGHITPTVLELSGDDSVFIQASADVERAARSIAFGMQLNGGETCIVPRRVFVHSAVASQFEASLRPILDSDCDGRSIEIITVDSDDQALELAAENPYALGAVIFGKQPGAARLAEKIRAGVVLINDMIVPTADPRVSFGGSGLSGFGTTRGEQGLLEMTRLKTVVLQQAKRLRHLEAPPPNGEALFSAYLAAAHRFGWGARWAALQDLARNLTTRGKHT
jgi:acyl-CoA reductase-like NAD-dependent aldehyde dehydrogenase